MPVLNIQPQALAVLGLLLSYCSLTPAQALKPGLWEIAQQIQAQGELAERQARLTVAMKKQIAAMPAEERKAFEKTLVNRDDPLGFHTILSGKICLPKGIEERVALHLGDGCPHTISPRVGNTVKFSYSCARPPNSGEGTLTIVSPKAYTLNVKAGATVQGQEADVTSQTKGKWLSSDCGSVRPILPID